MGTPLFTFKPHTLFLTLGVLLSTCGPAPSSTTTDPKTQRPTHTLSPQFPGATVPSHRNRPPLSALVPPPKSPTTASRGVTVQSCEFDYGQRFPSPTDWVPHPSPSSFVPDRGALPWEPVAHNEPLPETTWQLPLSPFFNPPGRSLVMPGYEDSLPLFERAGPWTSQGRCYELPTGSFLFTEEEAFDFYSELIQKTLGYELKTELHSRTVIGLRGLYPGSFFWNGNFPDRFNDTLALLWRDALGKHVQEFPLNADTGTHDFGYHKSSSLVPNRHYSLVNGWHRNYNALQMRDFLYPVRDDANKNGHWDDDRNGWYSLGPSDHHRVGAGHNLHMAARDAPLEEAPVSVWSAGCQVIPGVANWNQFIEAAWTSLGDTVDYFLVDGRDISHSVWRACDGESGTHRCPIVIDSLPWVHQDTTSRSSENTIERYNCSSAIENGPELTYTLNLRQSGVLSVTVRVDDETNVDPDVHLLSGDDPNACIARGHRSFSLDVTPGLYWIIVDTWTNEAGDNLAGPYTLEVTLYEEP